MTVDRSERSLTRTRVMAAGRVVLGLVLVFAGVSHLSFARESFQAQVPEWVPLSPDLVVVASGIVEIGLGLALVTMVRHQLVVGVVVAAFFVAVFPGNIAQWTGHRTAFGLDTDAKRFVRLLFQPLLVLWALASTGGLGRRARDTG